MTDNDADPPDASGISFKPQERKKRRTRRHSVIVIGAGMSGLACARELLHRGHWVLVVEARSRVGGRLKGEALHLSAEDNKNNNNNIHKNNNAKEKPTGKGKRGKKTKNGRSRGHSQRPKQDTNTDTNDRNDNTRNNNNTSSSTNICHVDLGGALIHGMDENPVADLTTALGVAPRPVAETLLLDADGWPIERRLDEKISTLFNACLAEAFARSEDPSNNTTATPSAPDPAAAATDPSFGALLDGVCRDRGISASALWNWHKANLEVSCGASLERLGWQWNEDEPYGFSGDHAALGQSWKAVVDALAEPLDILYDAPIQHIHVVHPKNHNSSSNNKSTNGNGSAHKNGTTTSHDNNGDADALQLPTRTRTVWKASPRRSEAEGNGNGTSPSLRQSRRLLGVGAEHRRSTRNSKRVNRWTPTSPTPTTGTSANHSNATTPTRESPAVGRQAEDPAEAGPSRSMVQITLQNGNVLEADTVVCTVPLGVLKAGTVQFEPPLPQPKQRAIQRLGTGLLNKCAISFSHAFWQDSDFLGMAGTQHSYLILNVAAYNTSRPPILVFMYGGDFAAEMEDWTDQAVVQDCLRVLRTVCGRRTLPEPVDYAVTRWGADPHAHMSFSYVPPGVDGRKELQTLGEPIYDAVTGDIPTLQFAGEHTTPYHPSTIHGAFISGIREACRLDFVIDPEGNDFTTFHEDEVYLRTFPIERRYDEVVVGESAVPDPAHSSVSVSQPRAAASTGRVIQFRRREESSVATTATSPSPAGASPSRRRSQRSATVTSPDVPVAAEHEMTECEIVAYQQKVDGQIDRSLLRGVESYGRNYRILRDLVMPVYGDEDDLSAADFAGVRERCKSLVSTKKRNKEYPSSATTWRTWGARVVYYPSKYQAPNRRSAKRKSGGTTSTPRGVVATDALAASQPKKPRPEERLLSPKPVSSVSRRRAKLMQPTTKSGRRIVQTSFMSM